MNPNVWPYLLHIGVFMGILVCIAIIHIALLSGLGSLASRWRGNELFRTLWLAIVRAIVVAVIALLLFISIIGFVLGGLRADWQMYVSIARIAFFALDGSLVVLGSVIAHLHI